MGVEIVWAWFMVGLLLLLVPLLVVTMALTRDPDAGMNRGEGSTGTRAAHGTRPRMLPQAPPLVLADLDLHVRDPNWPVNYLADLVTRVGRIFSLRLGRFPSILVAKASIAEEALREDAYGRTFYSQFHMPSWRRLVGSHAHCVPNQGPRLQAIRRGAAKLLMTLDNLASTSTAHNPRRELAISHSLAIFAESARSEAVVTVMDVLGPMICDLMLLLCFGEYPTPMYRGSSLPSMQVRAVLEGMASTGTAVQANPLLSALEWIQGVRLLHRVHHSVKQRSYNFMLSSFTSAVLPLIERCRARYCITARTPIQQRPIQTPTPTAARGRRSFGESSDTGNGLDEFDEIHDEESGFFPSRALDISLRDDFWLTPSAPINPQLVAFVSQITSHGLGTYGLEAADSSYLVPFLYAGRGMELTMEETVAVCLEFLHAGYQTMTRAVECAMSYLISNQEKQDKLFMEISRVVGHWRAVEETDLRHLHYLDAFVRETLRLNPPVPLMTAPSPTRSCQLAGFNIPMNATMHVHLNAIGKDPLVWNDPDHFIPERFSVDYNRELGRSMIPFGVGKLSCPARRLSAVTIKLVIARMVQKFRWNPPPGNENVPAGVPGNPIPRSSVKACITART